MASFGVATFEQASSSAIAGSVSTSDPDVRLRASGGEIITAGQTPRTARIDAYCTTLELEALRNKLVAGVLDTLELDDETLANAFLSEITDPTDIHGRGIWSVSLTFEVATLVVTPHLVVWLNGDPISDVINVTTDVGGLATATIICATSHDGARGQPVRIEGGIDDNLQSIFEGRVKTVSADYYPGAWTITCSGYFDQTQRQVDSDITYTGYTDGEMVDDLLARRGVPTGKRDIGDAGWTLGTKAPVKVRKGDTYQSWIRRLDEVVRYRTYENQAGTTARRRDDPFEIGTSTATLTEGENILSIQFGDDVDAIRNDIVLTGISHNGVDVTGAAFVNSPELDALHEQTDAKNTLSLNSSLIETDADAGDFADVMLADLAPLQYRLTITIPLDPAFDVDQTITVNAPSFGFTGAIVMVRTVKHTIDGAGGTTILTTNSGNIGSL